MNFEEQIFYQRKFIYSKMMDYGFYLNNDLLIYEKNIFDGDFKVIVCVDRNGKVSSKVIDNFNGEEFFQLKFVNYKSSFANSVNEKYLNIMKDIAEKCCESRFFESNQANRIIKKVGEIYGINPDFPWKKKHDDDSAIFRHSENRKWFALISNIRLSSLKKEGDGKIQSITGKYLKDERIDIINLKTDVDTGKNLRKIDGIYLGYHMNKKYWISVSLVDILSDEFIIELIDNSFNLTKK